MDLDEDKIQKVMNQIDFMYLVLAAPGHDDVGMRHGGRDVVVEGGLDVAGILRTKL